MHISESAYVNIFFKLKGPTTPVFMCDWIPYGISLFTWMKQISSLWWPISIVCQEKKDCAISLSFWNLFFCNVHFYDMSMKQRLAVEIVVCM